MLPSVLEPTSQPLSATVVAACGLLDTLGPGAAVLFGHARWDEYDAVADYRDGGRRSAKVTFDRGRLEIMTKSFHHESFLKALDAFISVLCDELDLDERGARETTIRREDLDRGIEPDGWYYLGATARKMSGRKTLDFTADPPPDLAIEVEVTQSLADRLGIYAAFGVREIWRFDGDTLRIQVLDSGRYIDRAASLFFPAFPADAAVRLIRTFGDVTDREWRKQVREWVRETFPNMPAA